MPPDLNDQVAFLSGVDANGRLELESFASWNNGTNPADYSGGFTTAFKWGANSAGTAGGTVRYYFDPASNWSPSTEQIVLASGLALWSAVANISFVATTDSSQAQITFTRGNDGKAITSHQLTGTNGAGVTGGTRLYTATSATISIDTSVSSFGPIDGNRITRAGGNVIHTVLHEIGHAIGLGHAGPYDGSVSEVTQQFSPYDNELWSIQSYISPRDTFAKYYSEYPVTGTAWGVHEQSGFYRVPTTWMPLDILAIQRLYGAPASTPLSGGQTFGFGSNISGALGAHFNFSVNTAPVITLWSAGGNNTFNISGWSTASNVNLNPGTFSSCGGMTNNIAIAFGPRSIFLLEAGETTLFFATIAAMSSPSAPAMMP